MPRHRMPLASGALDLLAKQRAFDERNKKQNYGGKFWEGDTKYLASKLGRSGNGRRFRPRTALAGVCARRARDAELSLAGPLRVRKQEGRARRAIYSLKLLLNFNYFDGGRTRARTLDPLIKS